MSVTHTSQCQSPSSSHPPWHRDVKQFSQGHTLSKCETRLQLLLALLLINKLHAVPWEDIVLFIFVLLYLGTHCLMYSRHLQNMCKSEYFWALKCPSHHFLSFHFTSCQFSSLQPDPYLVPLCLGKSASWISLQLIPSLQSAFNWYQVNIHFKSFHFLLLLKSLPRILDTFELLCLALKALYSLS